MEAAVVFDDEEPPSFGDAASSRRASTCAPTTSSSSACMHAASPSALCTAPYTSGGSARMKIAQVASVATIRPGRKSRWEESEDDDENAQKFIPARSGRSNADRPTFTTAHFRRLFSPERRTEHSDGSPSVRSKMQSIPEAIKHSKMKLSKCEENLRSQRKDQNKKRAVHHGTSFYINESHRCAKLQKFALDILSSQKFDAVIGAVIIANAVTIGFELSLKVRESMLWDWLLIAEHVFLAIYVCEIILRFFALGWRCLQDNWVKFDLFLVSTGVVSSYLLGPIQFAVSSDREASSSLGMIMVLRVGRLFRLSRALRLIVSFRELWQLVQGLITSASTMCYTLLLLVVVLYIFACVGVELITTHELNMGPEPDPEFQEVVEVYFRGVVVTMLTLVQFICLDSIGSIYKPLIEKDMMLAVYFIAVILVIGIVLMNLITAVIVNGAMEQALADKDAIKLAEQSKKKKLVRDLRRLFIRLDEDHSETISAEELGRLNDDDRAMMQSVLNVSDPVEIFQALDVDDSGALSIDEFCDAVWQVSISSAPLEMKRMEKQVNSICAQLQDQWRTHCDLTETLAELRLLVQCARPPDGDAVDERREDKFDERMLRDAGATSLATATSEAASVHVEPERHSDTRGRIADADEITTSEGNFQEESGVTALQLLARDGSSHPTEHEKKDTCRPNGPLKGAWDTDHWAYELSSELRRCADAAVQDALLRLAPLKAERERPDFGELGRALSPPRRSSPADYQSQSSVASGLGRPEAACSLPRARQPTGFLTAPASTQVGSSDSALPLSARVAWSEAL